MESKENTIHLNKGSVNSLSKLSIINSADAVKSLQAVLENTAVQLSASPTNNNSPDGELAMPLGEFHYSAVKKYTTQATSNNWRNHHDQIFPITLENLIKYIDSEIERIIKGKFTKQTLLNYINALEKYHLYKLKVNWAAVRLDDRVISKLKGDASTWAMERTIAEYKEFSLKHLTPSEQKEPQFPISFDKVLRFIDFEIEKLKSGAIDFQTLTIFLEQIKKKHISLNSDLNIQHESVQAKLLIFNTQQRNCEHKPIPLPKKPSEVSQVKIQQMLTYYIQTALRNRWCTSENPFPITFETLHLYLNYEIQKINLGELTIESLQNYLELLSGIHKNLDWKAIYHPSITSKLLANSINLNLNVNPDHTIQNDSHKDSNAHPVFQNPPAHVASTDRKSETTNSNNVKEASATISNRLPPPLPHVVNVSAEEAASCATDSVSTPVTTPVSGTTRGKSYKQLAIKNGWSSAHNIYPISLENLHKYIDHELIRVKNMQIKIGSLHHSISGLQKKHDNLGLDWDAVRYHPDIRVKLGLQSFDYQSFLNKRRAIKQETPSNSSSPSSHVVNSQRNLSETVLFTPQSSVRPSPTQSPSTQYSASQSPTTHSPATDSPATHSPVFSSSKTAPRKRGNQVVAIAQGFSKLAYRMGWVVQGAPIFPISLELLHLYIDHELIRVSKNNISLNTVIHNVRCLGSYHRGNIDVNWNLQDHITVKGKLGMNCSEKRKRGNQVEVIANSYSKLASAKNWSREGEAFPITLETLHQYIDHELIRVAEKKITLKTLMHNIRCLGSHQRVKLGLKWTLQANPSVRKKLGLPLELEPRELNSLYQTTSSNEEDLMDQDIIGDGEETVNGMEEEESKEMELIDVELVDEKNNISKRIFMDCEEILSEED
ncbi:hypothetical protein HK099_004780 [Clydaea vesicula]|uniref:Uncharacterized protein n=1 Tax=Clydaea vesicula TaxID=447962 RepID=A0AAD5U004_9FUNG|nr:hypothetical protein HK099_004780 [Clydaea vesicula]